MALSYWGMPRVLKTTTAMREAVYAKSAALPNAATGACLVIGVLISYSR
jgi:hypothetical protein